MYIELSYTHTHTHTKSYTYYLFLQFENTHKGVSFEACRNLELSRISKDSAKKKKKSRISKERTVQRI